MGEGGGETSEPAAQREELNCDLSTSRPLFLLPPLSQLSMAKSPAKPASKGSKKAPAAALQKKIASQSLGGKTGGKSVAAKKAVTGAKGRASVGGKSKRALTIHFCGLGGTRRVRGGGGHRGGWSFTRDFERRA